MTEMVLERIKYVRVHGIICVQIDTMMMVNLRRPSKRRCILITHIMDTIFVLYDYMYVIFPKNMNISFQGTCSGEHEHKCYEEHQ